MKQSLRFEDLPHVINQLTNEICDLKKLVQELSQDKTHHVNEWLTTKEAADFMQISKVSVDKKVQSGEFPRRLRNNKLVFKKSELEQFMETGKFPESVTNKNKAYEHMISKFSRS